jgi:1-acyl-sn-glycerol-3-phosphate acyltransferase
VIERFVAATVTTFARFVTGVRGNWVGCLPDPRPRVYYGNHNSHGDFVLIWTVLPGAIQRITRPVAGSDYWLKGPIRRYIGERVFNAVLIDRTAPSRALDPPAPPREADPVALMITALDQGSSLIFFPEGTRNTGDQPLLPFRSGLYNIAKNRPGIELVPVWINNLNRVMPKGEVIPIPLLCTVTFGSPIQLEPDEDRTVFVARGRAALLALAPQRETES